MKKNICSVILLCALFTGCAKTDVILRPERTTYIKPQNKDFDVKVAGKDVLSLRCLEWNGNTSTQQANEQCLYFAADEQQIFETFAGLATQVPEQQKQMRNVYTSFLLNLSDKNCSTFLGRAFANKAFSDAGKTFAQDMLTGSSAAAATLSAPTAATLSVVNLMVGKGVDNVNNSFFFDKAFQALATAIAAERQSIRTNIQNLATEDYAVRPIYDSLALLRQYDDACSVRVGLGKLQDLAQATKEAKAAAAKDSETIIALRLQVTSMGQQLADLKQQLTPSAADSALAVASAQTGAMSVIGTASSRPRGQLVSTIAGSANSKITVPTVQAVSRGPVQKQPAAAVRDVKDVPSR